MDLYEDTFKLQDMIDSDIRTELDFPSDISDISDMPILTALTPAEPLDNCSESENWSQNSHLYGIDVDVGGGILVNPQTGVPIGLIQPQSVSTPTSTVTLSVVSGTPISTSPTVVIAQPTTVQITHIVTPPNASDFVQHVDQQQLNITVPVPTPSPSPKDTNPCIQNLPQVVIQNQKTESNVASLKSKQKGKGANNNNRDGLGQNNGQMYPDKFYPKPAYSYSCLIAMALKNSQTGSLPVNEIYNFMIEHFPYFKTAPTGWKNSVRHNLSLNKCFEKVEPPVGNGSQRKGCLWAMNPAKVVKMDEELQKWSNKDPIAIRRSMANPERLSLLEKGHLKKILAEQSANKKDDDKIENSPPTDNVNDMIDMNIIGTMKVEPITTDMPPIEGSMNLDPSLHGIDLQKGIWEELCDDRLQFLHDVLSPSTPSPSPNIENDCEKQVLLQDTKSLSFVHGNYVYSQADNDKTLNSLNSSQQILLKLPSVEVTDDNETKCNS